MDALFSLRDDAICGKLCKENDKKKIDLREYHWFFCCYSFVKMQQSYCLGGERTACLFISMFSETKVDLCHFKPIL